MLVCHRFLLFSLSVPELPPLISPIASVTSSNTIAVSWTAAPTVSCPSVDDNTVFFNITGATRVVVVRSTELTATVDRLQPATAYSLEVAARSNGFAGVLVDTSPATLTTLLASTYVCAN